MTTTPSLSNYFSIKMDPANPYLCSTIKVHIPPSNDPELIKSFERAYQSYLQSFSLDHTGSIFYELKDPFVLTFSLLEPKDLAHFSKVSKCCFLATKIPLIWECQHTKLLSNVSVTLPNVACSSSLEERFKIMFKTINDVRKPYIWQFNRNNESLNELRGSNGMNGVIHRAWEKVLEPVKQSVNELDKKYNYYKYLDWERIFLAGSNYDGTAETIDPDSQQGRLLKAINTLVREAFNDPDQYKTIILLSEIKKVDMIYQNDWDRVLNEEFAEESWCFVS